MAASAASSHAATLPPLVMGMLPPAPLPHAAPRSSPRARLALPPRPPWHLHSHPRRLLALQQAQWASFGPLVFLPPHPQSTTHPSPAARAQDVLVVTAPGSGAEIIPFLKTWVNLPMAIGFTVLYTKVRTGALLRGERRAGTLASLRGGAAHGGAACANQASCPRVLRPDPTPALFAPPCFSSAAVQRHEHGAAVLHLHLPLHRLLRRLRLCAVPAQGPAAPHW